MTPAIVRPGGRAALSRRWSAARGAPWWHSPLWALACTVAALALVLSIPLWFVPPLVLVLPPLIWGWLTYRVLSFDVLAEHASADERRQIMRSHRWPLLGWAWSAASWAPAFAGVGGQACWRWRWRPLLVLVAVWLYTLVFAFAALWFAHYALAALAELRGRRMAERRPRSRATSSPAPRHCPEAQRRLPSPLPRPASHELRPHHRRRRDPLRQAPGQAPAQGHRTAGRARPGAVLGALRGRRPGASPPRCACLCQRRPGLQLRRHRRHARRPHPPVRRRGAGRAAGAAPRGARADPGAHARRGAPSRACPTSPTGPTTCTG
jgi:hypothetical protein